MNDLRKTNSSNPGASKRGPAADCLGASTSTESSMRGTSASRQPADWAHRHAMPRPLQSDTRRCSRPQTPRACTTRGQPRPDNTSSPPAGPNDCRTSPSSNRRHVAATCGAGCDAERESGIHGLVAVVDETFIEPADGPVYLLAAVLLADGFSAGRAFHDAVFRPGRVRNFHWSDEGPKIQRAARQLIRQHAAGRHLVAQRTSRTGQEDARSALMASLVLKLAADGIDSLIIESRGRIQDRRDREVILDCIREHHDIEISYGWRDKSEPSLWFADALAGAVREEVFGKPRATSAQDQLGLTAADIEWLPPNPVHA